MRNEATLRLFQQTCGEQHQWNLSACSDPLIFNPDREGMSVEVLQLPPIDPAYPTFWDSGIDEGTEVRIMRVTMREDG